MNKKYMAWNLWIAALVVLSAVFVFFSLGFGSAAIPKSKILTLLYDALTGRTASSPEATIIFTLRMPRIILGFAVGGALALAGVIFQGIFRNPLVEPYTLGVSGGAAIGVSMAIVLGLSRRIGAYALPLFGFLGAVFVILLVYSLSARKGVLKIRGLLLTGVMISFISSSLIMLIMAISRTEELHGILFWIMGSLEEPNWLLIKIALIVSVMSLAAAYMFCVDLNAFTLGEEEARHLGVDTEWAKRALFIIASLLTGVSVAIAGVIGFVGLVVPHFVRMFIGRDHRILLIASYFCGAIFLICCDSIARSVASPMELPVGVITGLLGGTTFIYLLTKKQSKL